MKKIVHILNICVFAAATLAIMGVVYEGYALEWFPIVGIFIMAADWSFILSTAVNLFFYRKNKMILSFSIASLIIIAAALVMKAMEIEYPVIALVLWWVYIWFYYGFMVSKKPETAK